MSTITYEDAVRVLDELAAERPDYVYIEESCHYTERDGNPGCIIGHLLDRLGFDRPGWGDATNNESVLSVVPILDAKTKTLLRAVQQLQDNGDSWSTAVEQAKKESNDLR